jgi:DNA-binding beta-propeller fold protein YncE
MLSSSIPGRQGYVIEHGPAARFAWMLGRLRVEVVLGLELGEPLSRTVRAMKMNRAILRTFALSLVAAASAACGNPPAAQSPLGAAPPASSATLVQAPPPRVPTPRDALLALSKRDHTLAIVDPASLAVLAKVPVGDDPHEVVATADGRTAYVSNYGGGTLHTLSAVDLVAQAPLPAVDLGPLLGPHGLAVKGDKIWFTAEGSKVVGSYDLKSHAIDWVLGTGQDRTHMIAVADDLRRIVTTNVASATVTFLEKVAAPPPGPPPGAPPPGMQGPPPGGPPGGWARERWMNTVVPVGRGDEGFDVSPDGREIWVANAEPGTISILDSVSKTVTQTLDAGAQGANRLKFTPDGKHVLVSSLHGGGLIVYDAHARTLEKRVPVGRGTSGILVEPGGKRAFVACSPDDDVAVLDLQTMTVVGHLAVGREPDGLAWATRP